MSAIADRIARLSPAERQVLLAKLQARGSEAVSPREALPMVKPLPDQKHEPFELTPIQQVYRSGTGSGLELGGCGSNVFVEYEVRGPGEAFLLGFAPALASLIERDDVFRIELLEDGRQRIGAAAPALELTVRDLRELPAAEIAAALTEIREELRYRVATEPGARLFDFVVVRSAVDRTHLLVRFDAVLTDGLSRDILVSDLFRLIEGGTNLPPKPQRTFRDFVVARRELASCTLYQRSRDHWLRRLGSLPPAPQLPRHPGFDPWGEIRFEVLELALLAPEPWAELKRQAGRRGLTPALLLLTLFADVLAEFSREPQFTLSLIGTEPIPDHPDLRSVVGNFNTVHLISFSDGGGSFVDRAERLKREVIDALENRFFSGFEALREMRRLRGEHERATLPIAFDSVVEYNHPAYRRVAGRPAPRAEAAADSGGLQIQLVEAGLFAPQLLFLPVMMERLDGALAGRWQTVRGAFPDGLITAMAESFERRLVELRYDRHAWDRVRFPGRGVAGRFASMNRWWPGQTWSDPQAARGQTWSSLQPAARLIACLVEQWTEVLGKAPRSEQENFFEAGGDSFSALLFLRRIAEQFGRRDFMTAFLGNATLHNLASLLTRQTPAPTASRRCEPSRAEGVQDGGD